MTVAASLPSAPVTAISGGSSSSGRGIGGAFLLTEPPTKHEDLLEASASTEAIGMSMGDSSSFSSSSAAPQAPAVAHPKRQTPASLGGFGDGEQQISSTGKPDLGGLDWSMTPVVQVSREGHMTCFVAEPKSRLDDSRQGTFLIREFDIVPSKLDQAERRSASKSSTQSSRSHAPEIVVREKDFKRYGNNLDLLKRCSLPTVRPRSTGEDLASTIKRRSSAPISYKTMNGLNLRPLSAASVQQIKHQVSSKEVSGPSAGLDTSGALSRSRRFSVPETKQDFEGLSTSRSQSLIGGRHRLLQSAANRFSTPSFHNNSNGNSNSSSSSNGRSASKGSRASSKASSSTAASESTRYSCAAAAGFVF